MKDFFNKLTPAERRLVVLVGIGVFIVINIWFIIPRFGEYGVTEDKRKKALKQVSDFQAEIKRKPLYEGRIRELSKQGTEVATEEAALRLSQEVSSQAALSGVTLPSISPVSRSSGGKTNAFFEEASVGVTFTTGEKELLDFLYRLADKDLLIRAKSMLLQPDQTRMRLQGNITLVKSYQRKSPPKAAPAAPAKSTNAPAKTPPKTTGTPSNTTTNKKK
ncbi:MAG: hypothetical protein QOF48_1610 [Verrucomicrobiota bacterium]|jgi:hypothetical protein